MALNEKYYIAAHAALEQRKNNNELLRLKRRQEVISRLPQYAELEARLSDTAAQFVGCVINKSSENLEALKVENLRIQRDMSEMLARGGFPSDYLDKIYTCPICLDKGCKDGKWCGCFMKLVYAAASKDLNDQSPMKLSHFEDFKLSYYPNTIDPNLGESIQKIMTENFKTCVDYAERFSGHDNSIFMIGATGLGKTHLSLAIANRIIERGFSVIYGSVPELLRMLDNEQFNRASGDTMSLLTGCDLLILDDLGAENGTDRTVSQLYEIINARINRGLPMIVNTNFSMQQIKARYQDRIWSRLFSMEVLMFCGTDNRIKLAHINK
ncbi:MAG: ATP-binding protein [Oscillospiraceae bacterium]